VSKLRTVTATMGTWHPFRKLPQITQGFTTLGMARLTQIKQFLTLRLAFTLTSRSKCSVSDSFHLLPATSPAKRTTNALRKYNRTGLPVLDTTLVHIVIHSLSQSEGTRSEAIKNFRTVPSLLPDLEGSPASFRSVVSWDQFPTCHD
jgi:hypothetical protein